MRRLPFGCRACLPACLRQSLRLVRPSKRSEVLPLQSYRRVVHTADLPNVDGVHLSFRAWWYLSDRRKLLSSIMQFEIDLWVCWNVIVDLRRKRLNGNGGRRIEQNQSYWLEARVTKSAKPANCSSIPCIAIVTSRWGEVFQNGSPSANQRGNHPFESGATGELTARRKRRRCSGILPETIVIVAACAGVVCVAAKVVIALFRCSP